jgi:hypothetical protein
MNEQLLVPPLTTIFLIGSADLSTCCSHEFSPQSKQLLERITQYWRSNDQSLLSARPAARKGKEVHAISKWLTSTGQF